MFLWAAEVQRKKSSKPWHFKLNKSTCWFYTVWECWSSFFCQQQISREKKKCHSAVIFQCQQHPAPVRVPEVFKLISFQFLKKTNYKATNTPFECKLRPLPEPHECIKRNPLWISTWEKHKGLCLLASSFFSLPPLPFTLQQIKKNTRGVLSARLSLPSSCLSSCGGRKEVELGLILYMWMCAASVRPLRLIKRMQVQDGRS